MAGPLSTAPPSRPIQVHSLGGLDVIARGSSLVGVVPAKALAVVVLLADRRRPMERGQIAGLLWSDATESRARSSLRVTLSRLRDVAPGVVEADRRSLWLATETWYDAEALDDPAHDALELCRGRFLDGFAIPGADLFDEWLAGRRAQVDRAMIKALASAHDDARTRGDRAAALDLARRWCEIDPWSEAGHRALAEALAATDGTSAARRELESFVERLAAEAGVRPEPSTIDLIASFNDPNGPVGHANPSPPPDTRSTPRIAGIPGSIPTWPTSLVGRDKELAHLESIAAAGTITAVTGPGGIGKSRLLAAHATQRDGRGEPTAFVSFAGHDEPSESSSDHAIAAPIASVLGVAVDAESGPLASLIAALADHEITLYLDNLESLGRPEATLTAIIDACPGAAVVVGTRRRLDLIGGREMPLGGLDRRPPGQRTTRASQAAQLFIERLPAAAGGQDPDLALVEEIAGRLDGHPLAMELAAYRAAQVSPSHVLEVLDERHTLSSTAEDLPERHRSLDSLLGESVGSLSPESRAALHAASAFSDHATATELMAIADADSHAVADLRNESLVTAQGEELRMHPVVRSFVRTLDPETTRQVDDRHCDLMLRAIADVPIGTSDLPGPLPRAEDARRAVELAIERRAPKEFLDPLRHYVGLLQERGWSQPLVAVVTAALNRDDLPRTEVAELHRHLAESHLHAGSVDLAVDHLETGLGLIGSTIPSSRFRRTGWNMRQAARLAVPAVRRGDERLDRIAERARLMSLLGESFYVSERRAEMMSYALGSIGAGRHSRRPSLVAAGDAALAAACQLAGAHRVADRYRRRGRRRLANNEDQDPFTDAMTRGVLALVAVGAGHWEDALADGHAGVTTARAAARPRIATQIEVLLALSDMHQRRYDSLFDRLEATEAEMTRNGFRRGLTWCQATRAEAALAVGNLDLARLAGTQALDTARAHGRAEDIARAELVVARCEALRGATEPASDLLRSAVPGLLVDSAVAIQHFDAHAGAAALADTLEVDEELRRRLHSRLRSYSRVFPTARERSGDIATELSAASS